MVGIYHVGQNLDAALIQYPAGPLNDSEVKN